jgi:Uma2 family endonuclease
MITLLETPRANLTIGFSYEDYLAFLERAEEGDIQQKFQYFDGEIIPTNTEKPLPEWFVSYVLSNDFGTQPITLIFDMPTQNHDIITSNLHGLLYTFSKGKDVRVYSQGTYIRLEMSSRTPLPDIVITSKSEEERNKYHQLLNPLAIIEILSKSTRKFDQMQKMEAYQSIETLMEYVLIDQYKPHVAVHRRISANKWEQEYLTKMSQQLHLGSISYSLTLSEIYEGVEFVA